MGERSPAYEAMEAAWAERAATPSTTSSPRPGGPSPPTRCAGAPATIPGELRGYLTVVPETRWVKHPVYGRHFEEELLDHYADHEADLRAVLAAAG